MWTLCYSNKLFHRWLLKSPLSPWGMLYKNWKPNGIKCSLTQFKKNIANSVHSFRWDGYTVCKGLFRAACIEREEYKYKLCRHFLRHLRAVNDIFPAWQTRNWGQENMLVRLVVTVIIVYMSLVGKRLFLIELNRQIDIKQTGNIT